ncbi:MAG: indolepyruvate ferredoxin oxidoreductase family protein, partial [Burkholderiaceae bacterium]
TVFMTGIPALGRLVLDQRRRDEAAGHRTGGYISGYQGSPLAAYDGALRRVPGLLEQHNIVYRPGVNEELAATAVWGSQYVGMFPGARVEGVFGVWFAKGPGVDRAMDALRHTNWAGTSKLGGVLALLGDDHGAKSSTVACYSDLLFESLGSPLLYPASVQEILDFGLHGIAMSRFSSAMVGMKLVGEIVESAGTVQLHTDQPKIVQPEFNFPPGGLAIRPMDMQLIPVEERVFHQRLYAALAYARANGLNRIVLHPAQARIGIVSAGKAWQDVRKALFDLGIDDSQAQALGIRTLKIGMVWPLEPEIVREFAQGLETLIVVEEKRPLLEEQVRSILYGTPAAPRIIGKVSEGYVYDAQPRWQFPNFGETRPAMISTLLARLLAQHHPQFEQWAPPCTAPAASAAIPRTPSYCSGCPHNRSTRLPDGSRAMAGIGCHGMAVYLSPDTTKTISQMGGEGMHWLGQQPFTDEKHVFANLGDGTYAHSGSLAIRQAVAANVPITFKLLANGFVSMTGGQPIAGGQTVPQMVDALRADGVQKIVVVTDDLEKYANARFPAEVPLKHRSELDAVQRELRDYPGVSVLVYEQPCATERRRLRKQGQWEDPAKRSFINSAVCEGCGDCGKVSTCLSIEPVETEFGRKRRINQSSCNKDFTCTEGFCPSFVTVHGGRLRKPDQPAREPLQPFEVPQAPVPMLEGRNTPFNVLVGGIGGTGVITIGQVLGVAAHIDGCHVTSLDMMGMAQKYGAVFSHLHFAADQAQLTSPRITAGETDTLIGCDLIVASGDEPVASLLPGRSQAVVCADLIATAEFARNADWTAQPEGLLERIRAGTGSSALTTVDGQRLAVALLGDAIAANMMMVGLAWQKGLIPLSRSAIERAIELNGVSVEMNRKAFAWGCCIASDPDRVERMIAGGSLQSAGSSAQTQAANGAQVIQFHRRAAPATLDETIERRVAELTDYGDAALVARYRDLVEAVRGVDTGPGHRQALTMAVARQWFRLLAVKDEWEVARLYTSEAFRKELEKTFEGDYTLHFHVGAWPFARTDQLTGKPIKREVGPWLMRVFKIMARLRGLRGGLLDPFRNSEERRLDRRLAQQYEADIRELIGALNEANYDTALAIANLPEKIRGFGHVRQAGADSVAATREQLLQVFSNPVLERARRA